MHEESWCRDMLRPQNHVFLRKSRNWKSHCVQRYENVAGSYHWDMSLPCTCPLVCPENFKLEQHEFLSILSLRHVRLLAHDWSWRGDMSQRHAAATRSCVFTRRWHVAGTCSWDTSSSDKVTLRTHKHVPFVWATHDFVAVACPCDVPPRYYPSFARSFKQSPTRWT